MLVTVKFADQPQTTQPLKPQHTRPIFHVTTKACEFISDTAFICSSDKNNWLAAGVDCDCTIPLAIWWFWPIVAIARSKGTSNVAQHPDGFLDEFHPKIWQQIYPYANLFQTSYCEHQNYSTIGSIRFFRWPSVWILMLPKVRHLHPFFVNSSSTNVLALEITRIDLSPLHFRTASWAMHIYWARTGTKKTTHPLQILHEHGLWTQSNRTPRWATFLHEKGNEYGSESLTIDQQSKGKGFLPCFVLTSRWKPTWRA